jgi:hypothetical protein
MNLDDGAGVSHPLTQHLEVGCREDYARARHAPSTFYPFLERKVTFSKTYHFGPSFERKRPPFTHGVHCHDGSRFELARRVAVPICN